MRSHIRYIARLQNSHVVQNAAIELFAYGTENPVAMFDAPVGGAALANPLITNEQGEAEAWLDVAQTVTVRISDNDDQAFDPLDAGVTLSFAPFTETVTAIPNPDDFPTQADIDAAIANLIEGAPGALDTLNELAAAMGDDPNFAATVTNSLAGKLGLSVIDAKGDLLVGTGPGAVARRPVGAEGTVLVARGAQATGMAWEAPTVADGAITNAKVAAAAAIAESKLNLASDAAAGTASRRSLGAGATQAAPGNHGHAQLHDRQHSVTAAADHSFPGGTTQFLRSDGVFATPSGGAQIATGEYTGDSTNNRTIALPFTPKFVMVVGRSNDAAMGISDIGPVGTAWFGFAAAGANGSTFKRSTQNLRPTRATNGFLVNWDSVAGSLNTLGVVYDYFAIG